MVIKGLVYKSEKSFFILKQRNRLVYYYLQRNLIKKFDKYLVKGTFVHFEVESNKNKHRGIYCYKVSHFIEISNKKLKNKKIYYSINSFRDGIKSLITNLDYTLFIDFEFNMHDFYTPNFISEIIEVGYSLCDNKLNVIKEKQLYLKPTKMKKVTKRSIKFLNYQKHHLDNRSEYKTFYNDFKNVMDKYNPCLIVWGKSDIENLKLSFKHNSVKYVNFKFIDLSQIHVNYYNLKNTPGLFKTAEEYNNIELPKQKHNALEDAIVTKLVFSSFKETIK